MGEMPRMDRARRRRLAPSPTRAARHRARAAPQIALPIARWLSRSARNCHRSRSRTKMPRTQLEIPMLGSARRRGAGRRCGGCRRSHGPTRGCRGSSGSRFVACSDAMAFELAAQPASEIRTPPSDLRARARARVGAEAREDFARGDLGRARRRTRSLIRRDHDGVVDSVQRSRRSRSEPRRLVVRVHSTSFAS